MNSTDRDPMAVALGFMKRASRDTFKVCADSAESLAAQIESGALLVDGATACRLLASMFITSSQRE
jgi:hypothetical protein